MITTDKIEALPHKPGVYTMKDKGGEILYVGKAKNLRKRLKSYFSSSREQQYTTKYLLSRAENLEYIVTRTEKEALILENNLIKKHRPRYNINLRDDKTFINLRIDSSEDFPRITMVRRPKRDGAKYLGPYSSARSLRETLRIMYRIFPLRTCSTIEFKRRSRPCINFGMKRCLAPCVGLVEKDAYMGFVKDATLFLVGKKIELLKTLKEKMKELSDGLSFEDAAMLRDQIRAIETTIEKQEVFRHTSIDQDIIGVYSEDRELVIQLLFVREGRLMGGQDFYFLRYEMPLQEILSSFITQYYRRDRFIPEEIILPIPLEDKEILQGWLREKRRDATLKLMVPQAGDRFKLRQMAERNAQEVMRRIKDGRRIQEDIIGDLMKELSLIKRPGRIEAIDISNLKDTNAVGSLVTFEDGYPIKKDYRLFRIKCVKGIDDYGMIREVISRRYRTDNLKRMPSPDLIMVDGGKGHLHVAVKTLKENKIDDVNIMAFAKAGKKDMVDKIYLLDRKDPVLLDRNSSAYLFLQRIRDEAHRFAIGYHKKLREKKITSILKDIPGVGVKKTAELLRHFGSIKNVKEASLEELCKVESVNEKAAATIYKTFHP